MILRLREELIHFHLPLPNFGVPNGVLRCAGGCDRVPIQNRSEYSGRAPALVRRLYV